MTDWAWIQRLTQQLPGWAVWKTSSPPAWHAVPAAPGTPRHDLPRLPNQVSASTPARLRKLARQRYGWRPEEPQR